MPLFQKYFFISVIATITLLSACKRENKQHSEPSFHPKLLKAGEEILVSGKLIQGNPIRAANPPRGKPLPIGEEVFIPNNKDKKKPLIPVSISKIDKLRKRNTPASPITTDSKGKNLSISWPKWVATPLGYQYEGSHLFSYLNMENGLNSDYIYTILEDNRGNVWLGSWGGGLSKWEKGGCRHFDVGHGMPSNNIIDLLEDRNGHIWIATFDAGVIKWDGVDFIHYSDKNGLIDNQIYKILEDNEGNIWLGGERGISIWEQDEKGERFRHYSRSQGFLFEDVNDLLEDQEGNIWIACALGLYRWDGKHFSDFGENSGLSSDLILNLLEDIEGKIWIATDNGLNIWNPDSTGEGGILTVLQQENLLDNYIRYLLQDHQGRIWIATQEGINIWDGTGFQVLMQQEGLKPKRAICILEDQFHRIWIGTDGKGVQILNKELIELYGKNGELGGPTFNELLEDSKGNIWLGSREGSIIKWDSTGYYQYSSLQHLSTGLQHAWGLIEDREGNIWIGSRGSGLILWHPERAEKGNHLIQYTKEAGLNSDFITALLEDHQGNIWIGYDDGSIHVWEKGLKNATEGLILYSREESSIQRRIFCFFEDHVGRIWIGTDGHGMAMWKDGNFTRFSEEQAFEAKHIYSFEEDQFDQLWMCTEKGLLKWEDEKYTTYTNAEGLAHQVIMNLIEDQSGDLWMGTYKGFDRLTWTEDRQNLAIKHFGEGGRFTNSSTYLLSGREDQIFVSTLSTEGYAILEPEKLQEDITAPQVEILDFQLLLDFADWRQTKQELDQNMDPLSEDRAVSLTGIHIDSIYRGSNLPANPVFPYDLNDISFRWGAIHPDLHTLSYSYVLDNGSHQDDWSPLIQQTQVDFRGLPHGTYVFRVRAVDENGQWSHTAHYSFIILPPWWRTWWAHSCYGLIACLILGGLYRYQKRRWLLQTSLQMEQAESQRLKELDEFKSRFFANITHEFRTPLTIIQGLAREIRENPRWKISDRSKLISSNTHKLLQLINQLLDLSKLEAGKLEPAYIQTDIIRYLNYLTESFHSLAFSVRISLSFSSHDEHLLMDFDPKILQQIISNLISNALKFTPEFGKVTVSAAHIKEDKKLEIKVRDTGSGIPTDKLPYIFDRFYQVDNSSIRQGEGTGLGLALAKELVELIGGTINVDSETGKGTCFTLQLPIHQKAEVREELPNIPSPVHLHDSATIASSLPPTTEVPAEAPLVLLVEDNPDVIYYLRSCLEGRYTIQEANNGQAGINTALETIPDLIISDVMMPEVDGFELCRILKTDERTNHIPILLLTAKANQADKIQGLTHGADVYLTKPFEKEELLIRLQNLLELRSKIQEKYQAESGKDSTQEDPFLQKVRAVIMAHLDDPEFGVMPLSRALGMSRVQVHRKLKALTNLSTTQNIRSIRLQQAYELLKNPDLSISEIGYQVGFKDPTHFSRAFSQQFGKSPRETRK